MSDIDSIEAAANQLRDMGYSPEGAVVDHAAIELRQLRQALAAVEKRCSDPAYVFDVGEPCIRVSDIRAALGVTPTPQETEKPMTCTAAANIAGLHVPCELDAPHGGWAHSNRASRIIWDGPVTSTPEAATEPTWLADIAAERQRAHAKHGETSMESMPAHDPAGRRLRILVEEVGEIAQEFNDAEHEQRPVNLAHLRDELIQTAAMAGAWADACSSPPAPSGLQRATEQEVWAVGEVISVGGKPPVVGGSDTPADQPERAKIEAAIRAELDRRFPLVNGLERGEYEALSSAAADAVVVLIAAPADQPEQDVQR